MFTSKNELKQLSITSSSFSRKKTKCDTQIYDFYNSEVIQKIPEQNLNLSNELSIKRGLRGNTVSFPFSLSKKTPTLIAPKNSKNKYIEHLSLKYKYLKTPHLKFILDESIVDSEEKGKDLINRRLNKKPRTTKQESKKFSFVTARPESLSTSLTKISLRNDNSEFFPNVKRKASKLLLSANLSKKLLNAKNEPNELREYKRTLATERFFFKVTRPLDCIEEHLIKNIKSQDKFVKFKIMLNQQKEKNIKIIEKIKKTVIDNNNLLNIYLTQLAARKIKSIRREKVSKS